MSTLAEFYRSDPATFAPMRAMPKRALAQGELPVLPTVHLRSIDELGTKTSSSSPSTPPPQQSLATMLALSAAAHHRRSSTSPTKCALHPASTEALLSEAEVEDILDGNDMDVHERRRTRPVLRFPALAPAGEDDEKQEQQQQQQQQEQQQAQQLMEHWNATIARRFLRNTATAVPTFPQVWVCVPFDTLLRRFLAMLDVSEDEGAAAGVAAAADSDDDFVDHALNTMRPSLQPHIISHLVGDCSELPSSLVAFPCLLVPDAMVTATPRQQPQQATDDTSAIPDIVRAAGAVFEWRAMKRWLSGCRVEFAAGTPLWLYHSGTETDMLTEALANRRRQRGGGAGEVPPTSPCFVASTSSPVFCEVACTDCRTELLQRCGCRYASYVLSCVAPRALLLRGLGAGWLDKSRLCFQNILEQHLSNVSASASPAVTALFACALTQRKMKESIQAAAEIVSPPPKPNSGADSVMCSCTSVLTLNVSSQFSTEQPQSALLTLHWCPRENPHGAWIVKHQHERTEEPAATATTPNTKGKGRKSKQQQQQQQQQQQAIVPSFVIPNHMLRIVVDAVTGACTLLLNTQTSGGVLVCRVNSIVQ